MAQSKSAQADQDTVVKYNVTPDVAAKASTPTPGPDAKQQGKQTTIGDGKAKVKTSQDNSFWVEDVDIDGSGKPVESQLLWDDSNKVLYTYADKPLTCSDGSLENGNFIIAMYGNNNPEKKPAGSGWWAANLDQGQCKAQTDQLFGCRFDATGNNTTCGVATLNETNNELTITTATKRQ
jgi:hypothetical protein